MGRFTYIMEFNNCSDCPFNEFVDDDRSPFHTECKRTNEYIQSYSMDGDEDYRNSDGVLDECPFLINNTIKD